MSNQEENQSNRLYPDLPKIFIENDATESEKNGSSNETEQVKESESCKNSNADLSTIGKTDSIESYRNSSSSDLTSSSDKESDGHSKTSLEKSKLMRKKNVRKFQMNKDDSSSEDEAFKSALARSDCIRKKEKTVYKFHSKKENALISEVELKSKTIDKSKPIFSPYDPSKFYLAEKAYSKSSSNTPKQQIDSKGNSPTLSEKFSNSLNLLTLASNKLATSSLHIHTPSSTPRMSPGSPSSPVEKVSSIQMDTSFNFFDIEEAVSLRRNTLVGAPPAIDTLMFGLTSNINYPMKQDSDKSEKSKISGIEIPMIDKVS